MTRLEDTVLSDHRLPKHLREIGADHAWRAGYRGGPVDGRGWIGVGIVDTGIDIREMQARYHLNRDRGSSIYAYNPTWDTEESTYRTKRLRLGGAWVDADQPRDYVDEFGHGTKMAGILGAVPGFDGVWGLVPRVRLYNYRVIERTGQFHARHRLIETGDEGGENALEQAVRQICIDRYEENLRIVLFALDQQVWKQIGGQRIRQMLRDLEAKDILAVVAASDTPEGGEDLDLVPDQRDSELKDHPAVVGRDRSNLLVVAAHDRASRWPSLIRTSNHGANSVHLAAPGRDIPSVSPMAPISVYGTSAAAALAAGAAALIAGSMPKAAAAEVRQRLLEVCPSVAEGRSEDGQGSDIPRKIQGGRILGLHYLRPIPQQARPPKSRGGGRKRRAVDADLQGGRGESSP